MPNPLCYNLLTALSQILGHYQLLPFRIVIYELSLADMLLLLPSISHPDLIIESALFLWVSISIRG